MKKALRRIISVLVLSALAATLCACGGGKTSSSESSITVGVAGDIDSMDPNLTVSAGTREILFNVYEGLVKPDSDGNLNPAIAESYTISEDAKTYTFKLRKGVLFHNGKEVKAEDVLFSIERCAEASAGNVLASAFPLIDSVESPDADTVVVHLKETNTEFLSYLTVPVVPADNDDYENNPVGTGPYRFVSRSPQENVVLEKFADYWDKDGSKGGNPGHYDKITVQIISNPDMMVMNLQGGQVDVIPHLSADQAGQLGEGFTVAEGTMNLVQALYLNNSVEPLNDVRVRQALCYALDRGEIFTAVSNGKGTAVGSSMYPAYGKYFMPELVDLYPQNIDKAKELLTEAGYPDGFELEITVPSNYKQHVDSAQVYAEQLKKIGVTAKITQVEWGIWVSDVYQGRNFTSTLVGVDGSSLSAPAMLNRFVSDNSKNFINYSNAEYDETFAQAISTVDDAAKTELYKRCEEILAEDAANVYIQDLPDLVGMNSKVTGYEFYPLYVIDLSALRPAE